MRIKILNEDYKIINIRELRKYSKYHNLIHGNKEGWEFRFSIDIRIPSEELEGLLPFNHYILRTINDEDGKAIRDKLNNPYYVISRDTDGAHTNDVLLLWELKECFKDCQISISGVGEILGNGFFKETPYLVLGLYYMDFSTSVKLVIKNKEGHLVETLLIDLDTLTVKGKTWE